MFGICCVSYQQLALCAVWFSAYGVTNIAEVCYKIVVGGIAVSVWHT